jgi:hypothetical protein
LFTHPKDYWSHANRVELAVLTRVEAKATVALSDPLALFRDPWNARSTAFNIGLMCEARERRGETIEWARLIEQVLKHTAERRELEQRQASG